MTGNYSKIEDKLKEYLFNKVKKTKYFFKENDFDISNIQSKEVRKVLKKFKKSFSLLNNNLIKALEKERLEEIFSDGVEIIRLATAIKIVYFSSKRINQIDYNYNNILEIAKLLEFFGRTKIESKTKNENENENNFFKNTKIKELNINENEIIYHPEINIYDLTLGFLKNLYLDESIDEIFLSLYGLKVFEKNRNGQEKINDILQGIINLSKIKKVTIILDPVPKFDKNLFNEALNFLNKNGLNIIIPRKKIHGKFIIGYGKKSNKIKYLLSSGNFIRDRINDGEYSKEDISSVGESKSNKGIGEDLLKIKNFLLSKNPNYTKLNFNNLIISPFGAKEKIIDMILKEEEEIYIATNVFYDKEIYDALLKSAEKGFPINIVIRDGLKIFIDEKILNYPNIKILKRRKKGIDNQQHSRLFSFKSQKVSYAGTLGIDPFRLNDSIEFLFKIPYINQKLKNNQLKSSKNKLNKKTKN